MLEGVQRVPSLLLHNPTQNLRDINLSWYTVLASEPLHDLKGHFHNLVDELLTILPSRLQNKCSDLVEAKLGVKVSAADIRATVISLYVLILKDRQSLDSRVVDLLTTAVKLCEILYSSEDKRSPKQILSLYNNAYLHMELCRDLFSSPKKLSRRRFFGTYLHALTTHAPLQYEVVCQKSINAENQERLFGQGRRAAEMASNRHPDNVMSTVLLRLQAKKELGKIVHSVSAADSQVSKAASSLPVFNQTTVTKNFTDKHKHSWQAHLERISPFLVEGRGSWWHEKDGSYIFLDGDSDTDHRTHGPTLLHFRQNTIQDVQQRHKDCWQMIAEQSIPIPSTQSYMHKARDNLQELPPRSHQQDDERVHITCTWNDLEDTQPSLLGQSTTPQTSVPSISTTSQTNQPCLSTIPPPSQPVSPPPSQPDTNTIPPPSQPVSPPPSQPDTNTIPPRSQPVSPSPSQPDTNTIPPPSQPGPTVSPPPSQPDTNTIPPPSQPGPTVSPPPSQPDTNTIPPPSQPGPTAPYSSHSPALRTKLARAIEKVTGITQKLVEFDNLRWETKIQQHKGIRVSRTHLEKHEKLKSELKQEVVNERAANKSTIKALEKDHYNKHNSLSNIDEDTQYMKMVKQLKHAKWLISMWETL